ncbi:GvpL/GvpF family gas vesicle protein [Algihabitans albus]|uniref:GvpL/GvpF family gas vesicle protein n=1 Tax=Algihabitans albus TaxID=2164067 RepID=UPI0035D074E0
MDRHLTDSDGPLPGSEPSRQGQYLYCVIAADKPLTFDVDGIGGAGDKVYSIPFDGLSAVVSASPEAEYDGTRRNLTAHMRVLETVMAEHTIVPIRFGSVAPTPDAVYETLLKPQRETIQSVLADLEGRVEMGLKVFWMEGVLYAEILKSRPDIAQLRDSLLGRSPDESYYERVKVGELLEGAVADKRAQEAEELMNYLAPLAYRVRRLDALGEQMVVNAALLMDRSKVDALDEAVSKLDASNAERLLFKLVGPTAPYNFVDLAPTPQA